MEFEPYEFYETGRNGNPVLKYRCYRGRCDGRAVFVADRKTHNNYHNHVDEGLPNPYASKVDFSNIYPN